MRMYSILCFRLFVTLLSSPVCSLLPWGHCSQLDGSLQWWNYQGRQSRACDKALVFCHCGGPQDGHVSGAVLTDTFLLSVNRKNVPVKKCPFQWL